MVRGVARDPRTIQIAAQSTFLVLETAWLDFGPSLPQAATFIATALAVEGARARIMRVPVNWKSALSAGLSLSLLLRTADPLLWIAAGMLAIGSKYLIRYNGKHLFNPSAFAIVALLLMTNRVWVSPGQWGTTIWLAALAATFGGLVLTRVARVDLAAMFLATYFGLLLAKAWSFGDPLTIPLHQIQSGGLLIFSMFMITDPRSTPDSRTGRMLFAAAIAVIAHAFLFRWQVREGVFYALALVSCFTPIVDRIWPGPRFAWPPSEHQTSGS
jgi:Na+-transporting NADH:ubiquinone oxidoreductase subunit NqrB